jgi:hypothetical protein
MAATSRPHRQQVAAMLGAEASKFMIDAGCGPSYGPTMTNPVDLEAVALDIARAEMGVEVQLQAVAANALDVRALVVFSGASAVGGIAARLVEPLTGLPAFLAGAATIVALGGMATAIRAFVPRVSTTVAPAAYTRVDPNHTVASLHARVLERRTEDYHRNGQVLRTKTEWIRSAFTVSVTAAGLLFLGGVLSWWS